MGVKWPDLALIRPVWSVQRTCIRDRYAKNGREGSIRGLSQPDGALPDGTMVPTVPDVAV